MIPENQGCIPTIWYCLKRGELQGAVLRIVVPLVILANRSLTDARYHLLKLKERGKGLIPVRINGRYDMYLDPADRGVCTELGISRTREVFSTAYFSEVITDDMTVIDIGANIGYYALLESQLASRGHVHAIEPVPKNHALLQKNIALNACRNITTYPCAIGDVNGSLEMFVYDKCNWSSFTRIPGEEVVETIMVPVMTLDAFVASRLASRPSFVRMDVEGYEYEILKGAPELLKGAGPLIFSIEMHPQLMSGEEVAGFVRMLKENGFSAKAIFLETDSPADIRYLGLINRLKGILGLPRCGSCGSGYTILEDLLARGYFPIVFFEKPAPQNTGTG